MCLYHYINYCTYFIHIQAYNKGLFGQQYVWIITYGLEEWWTQESLENIIQINCTIEIIRKFLVEGRVLMFSHHPIQENTNKITDQEIVSFLIIFELNLSWQSLESSKFVDYTHYCLRQQIVCRKGAQNLKKTTHFSRSSGKPAMQDASKVLSSRE